MLQSLVWDSVQDAKQATLVRLLTPTQGQWEVAQTFPSLTVRRRHPQGSSSQGFFRSKGHGASQLRASQGFGPTMGQCDGPGCPLRPHWPWHPSIRTRSQQLNKVSFICDIQIQPMQKEITFPFDSSDKKLLKKKIYISRSLSSISSKKKNPNPERVKKNHIHVIHTFDINKNNLK